MPLTEAASDQQHRKIQMKESGSACGGTYRIDFVQRFVDAEMPSDSSVSDTYRTDDYPFTVINNFERGHNGKGLNGSFPRRCV